MNKLWKYMDFQNCFTHSDKLTDINNLTFLKNYSTSNKIIYMEDRYHQELYIK